MKRFVAEIALFIVAIVGVYILALQPQVKGFPRYMQNLKPRYEIVNLGTSHGYDFDYSQTKRKGVPVNKEGNTLYYDLQHYRYLNNRELLKKGAVVVVPISYFAFGLEENRKDLGEKESFTNDFYFYLGRKQIYKYSPKKEARLKTFELQKNIKMFICAAQNFQVKKSATRRKKQHSKTRVTQHEKLQKHAKGRTKRHKQLALFHDAQKNVAYVETLLREIFENGHVPILTTVPYSIYYNNGFDSTWLANEYFMRLRSLSSSYNITYLDYSHDPMFSPESHLFQDSDHLNKEGKRLFSQVFFKELEEIGVFSYLEPEEP